MDNVYVFIEAETGFVGAIIPEIDAAFPDIPVNERYAADFLAECKVYTAATAAEKEIIVGKLYDAESDTFAWPPFESTPEPELEPEPKGYTITEEEVSAAYEEGVNNVE